MMASELPRKPAASARAGPKGRPMENPGLNCKALPGGQECGARFFAKAIDAFRFDSRIHRS